MLDILNKTLLPILLLNIQIIYCQKIIINKNIYFVKYKNENSIIYKNDIAIDTIKKTHILSYQFHSPNNLILWTYNEVENVNEGLIYDLQTYKTLRVGAQNLYFYNRGTCGSNLNGSRLEIFYLEGTTYHDKTTLSIDSLTPNFDLTQSNFDICFIQKNKFFVHHYYSVGSKDEIDHEFYSINNGKILRLITPPKIDNFEVIDFEKIADSNNLIFTSYQYQKSLRYIYNIETQQQEIILGVINTGRYNFKNCIQLPNQKTGYILETDNSKIVVPFDQSLLFETCLYSIVNQKEINKDLNLLPKSEIELLLESIYAAHLVEFKDESLTNFFSCYWFYSLENESVKNKGYLPKSQIKLTETDLYNLKLLQQALKSAPK
jgi:hypothetical protein